VAEQTVEDLVARLERERLEADRRYNDALTAVDAAIQSVARLPEAPAAFDGAALVAVNRSWDILPSGAPSLDGSLKGRLRSFIWRMVGPPLEAQKHFNASLVDHLNRNTAAQQQLPTTVATLVEALRQELQSLVRFESLLVQYLQTITAYVDTKDRNLASTDLRERLAITEQRLIALKHDVENAAISRGAGEVQARRAMNSATDTGAGTADAAAYVAFEDRFRGPQHEIRRRVEDYLPILSASEVVDVGCGRGELLELLRQQGVRARGVDANAAMAELCRARGLDVEAGDALEYLDRQSDGSIGGLTAIQVVEHFEPRYLARFLDTAYRKMRPGAPIVLETINPACWMAFFETYIRDLTHQRPLHPETLRYLVQASGFHEADVQFRQPVGEGDRLNHVIGAVPSDLEPLVKAINAHADKLNARLFSAMDYAVIARR
jgi:2-polyprenyl-3-methyl-5-hydroxy-6-metoxy-1,4-benzoquinol methylase